VNGHIWVTLNGVNKFAELDPKTGATTIYDGPPTPGYMANAAGLYQGVQTADGKHVWFTQLGAGQLFRFDVSSKTIDKLVKFPRGSGPRRITITDGDVIYIPLQGSNELAAYDANSGEHQFTHAFPEAHCGSYTATWDTRRRLVWIPCSNSDQVYSFNPKSKQFTSYLLPRPAPLIRAITVDPVDGDVVFTYAPVAAVKPNNLLVVLQPAM
jgi:streptogramin lyase